MEWGVLSRPIVFQLFQRGSRPPVFRPNTAVNTLADLAPLPLPQLLLVDDDAPLRTVLARFFEFNQFAVRTAADVPEARRLVQAQVPDLILLDVNMPGESGLSLLRWLREQHPHMGIIMVSGARSTVDRVVGLEVGADDYVTKPFETRELLARVRSLWRRVALLRSALARVPAAADPGPLQRRAFGGFELDLAQRRLLRCDGQDVALTPAEFDLLALFVRHPHKVMSRSQIAALVEGRERDVYDRSIDLRILRLRRKIEARPERPQMLRTVRGAGYVFDPLG